MTRTALIALVALAAGCDASAAPDPGPALATRGRALFFGRAGCVACHSVGSEGGRVIGPNLGVDAATRTPLARRTRGGRVGLEYVVESIVAPDAFVVPGYARGVMPALDRPPVALTDDEIVAIAVFLTAGEVRIDGASLEGARRRVAAARRDRDHAPHP